jgi:hypothetical protein
MFAALLLAGVARSTGGHALRVEVDGGAGIMEPLEERHGWVSEV